MANNSLTIFQQLFLKHPKEIKDVFANVTALVEDKDRAIADFLSVEYPELIWLIRVLHIEYEKQFSPTLHMPQQTVEKIARSITLTVDETGTTNYGQTEHNDHILNTLETHLSTPRNNCLQDTPQQDDIISLDGSNPDMDIVYQKNTSFNDIAQQIAHSKPPHEDTVPHRLSCLNSSPTTNIQNNTQTPDAFQHHQYQNNKLNATVTQAQDSVTHQNTSDVIDVTHIVDQVVSSRGSHKTLSDSMHAPNRQSLVNLPPKDLRHRLNALRHKNTSDRPGFLLIKASSVPGYNRLDKLNFVRNLFHTSDSFQDINWRYHDKQAAIIVEHATHNATQQAAQSLSLSHPDLESTIIKDLRQLLYKDDHHTHTPRLSSHDNFHNPSTDKRDHTVVGMTEQNQNYTYRLRHVPGSISQQEIQSHLSYYGNVTALQEIDNLPPHRREILCYFDSSANSRLLEHIWAVNIQGYNISIAKAHFTDRQLEYRKQFVAGFRGFHYKTTESQALRKFRPYGGMSCYFHQNLAYIAFKTYDQMVAACQLRLYTDDDRLLTGRPRLARNFLHRNDSDITHEHTSPKAMTFQSGYLPDLNVYQQDRHGHGKNRKVRTLPRQDHDSQMASDHCPDEVNIAQTTDQLPQLPIYHKHPKHSPSQDDHTSWNPLQSSTPLSTPTTTSQLDLILAKLSELDAIKQHITTLDQRMNLIQPPPNVTGLVANRS